MKAVQSQQVAWLHEVDEVCEAAWSHEVDEPCAAPVQDLTKNEKCFEFLHSRRDHELPSRDLS